MSDFVFSFTEYPDRRCAGLHKKMYTVPNGTIEGIIRPPCPPTPSGLTQRGKERPVKNITRFSPSKATGPNADAHPPCHRSCVFRPVRPHHVRQDVSPCKHHPLLSTPQNPFPYATALCDHPRELCTKEMKTQCMSP